MDVMRVERIDHHGIVSGVIKDLGIIEAIDKLIGVHAEEKISTGEAIAGMIINGLGFTDRPMTLTPQFFENCPVELLFREGVMAEDFNRFKLGRALDDAFDFGCDLLFAQIAKMACQKEGIDTRFGHLDTTSFSLTGEYDSGSDEHAIKITHGYSKDHRPDLKQVVLEMMVTRDGGVPIISKAWDGNTSDNEIFNMRAKLILESLKNSNSPTYLIADSKLYSEENAVNLKDLPFITRIPETIGMTKKLIQEALSNKYKFVTLSEKRSYQEFALIHNEMSQRWFVVFSQVAKELAEISVLKKLDKEKERIKKELFHLQAEQFSCEEDGRKQLEAKSKNWIFHTLDSALVVQQEKYKKSGRPKTNETPNKTIYKITASFSQNTEAVNQYIEQNSCYIVGTNVDKENLSAKDAIEGYSQQQTVEKGFRFLKDPLFFTSSLFIKKQSRIEAMLMVMTLALLVYSIAERKLRGILKTLNQTLPNQIKKEVQNPTLRWIFQILDGINRVKIKIKNKIIYTWTGLSELRLKILCFFGSTIKNIYQIA
jgi:transposase